MKFRLSFHFLSFIILLNHSALRTLSSSKFPQQACNSSFGQRSLHCPWDRVFSGILEFVTHIPQVLAQILITQLDFSLTTLREIIIRYIIILNERYYEFFSLYFSLLHVSLLYLPKFGYSSRYICHNEKQVLWGEEFCVLESWYLVNCLSYS